MGKKSELSIEVRAEIVTKYNCGISVKDICEEYDLSRQTVHYQINKHKKTNSVQNLAKRQAYHLSIYEKSHYNSKILSISAAEIF